MITRYSVVSDKIISLDESKFDNSSELVKDKRKTDQVVKSDSVIFRKPKTLEESKQDKKEHESYKSVEKIESSTCKFYHLTEMINKIISDNTKVQFRTNVAEYMQIRNIKNPYFLNSSFFPEITSFIMQTSKIIGILCSVLQIDTHNKFHNTYDNEFDNIVFDLANNRDRLEEIKSKCKFMIFDFVEFNRTHNVIVNLFGYRIAKQAMGDLNIKKTLISLTALCRFEFKKFPLRSWLIVMLKEFNKHKDEAFEFSSVIACIALQIETIKDCQSREMCLLQKGIAKITLILLAYSKLKNNSNKEKVSYLISKLFPSIINNKILYKADYNYMRRFTQIRNALDTKRNNPDLNETISYKNSCFIAHYFSLKDSFLRLYLKKDKYIINKSSFREIYLCLIRQAFKTFDEIIDSFTSNLYFIPEKINKYD